MSILFSLLWLIVCAGLLYLLLLVILWAVAEIFGRTFPPEIIRVAEALLMVAVVIYALAIIFGGARVALPWAPHPLGLVHLR